MMRGLANLLLNGDNEKYILGDLRELEIAYDALKREFNIMRSTYG